MNAAASHSIAPNLRASTGLSQRANSSRLGYAILVAAAFAAEIVVGHADGALSVALRAPGARLQLLDKLNRIYDSVNGVSNYVSSTGSSSIIGSIFGNDGPVQSANNISAMRISNLVAAAALATIGAAPAIARDVPGWVRLLHYISGDNVATAVPTTAMGSHMQMSRKLSSSPGDAVRADAIVEAARGVLARYPSTAAAEKAGYKPFNQTGAMGEEIHYTSFGASYAEGRHINYARPGSILFRRTPAGWSPSGSCTRPLTPLIGRSLTSASRSASRPGIGT